MLLRQLVVRSRLNDCALASLGLDRPGRQAPVVVNSENAKTVLRAGAYANGLKAVRRERGFSCKRQAFMAKWAGRQLAALTH